MQFLDLDGVRFLPAERVRRKPAQNAYIERFNSDQKEKF